MNESELNPKRGWQAATDWYWLTLLLCIVTLGWCAAYNRWTAEGWKIPVSYTSDAWVAMAMGKAFAGEVAPLWPKHVTSLGAPFDANWSDYPIAAEGILAWYGLLVRIFGIFAGSNVALFSAHLLAAASFYVVCRILGYRELLSIAGAALFSMSHFAFARNLVHLVLSFYWHVPLGLLVVWWCGRSAPLLNDRKKILLCVAVAILHGIQDPYYTGIFLQFLVLTSLVCLIRREPWSRVMVPLFLASIVFVTCILVNTDTIYNRLVQGPNPQALIRQYSGLEQYALKPVELLLPYPHRIAALETWAHKTYFAQALVLGEVGFPYLGIIGIVALGALLWSTVRAAINHGGSGVPSHFWLILWIFLYSVSGGVNGLLGLFGVLFFRATNRYSIVILALALLFLVRQLTLLTRKWHWLPVSVLAVAVSVFGFLDQSPHSPTVRDIAKVRDQVLSDGKFVSTLEAKLPARAMVFELPVWDFPETPPLRGMLDYEHFRPYLQSRSLRFSYGNIKGRPRERWQREAERLDPDDLITVLEKYGFSTILINKKAYEDRAASLLSGLRGAGRADILAESSDLVSVALHPRRDPLLPPEFDEHWHNFEGDLNANRRWSNGTAKLTLYNPQRIRKPVHLAFYVDSLLSRHIDIYAGSQEIYSASIAPPGLPEAVEISVSLLPGPNDFLFRTDRPGEAPGNGDPRKLAFALRNFKVIE